MKTSKSRWISLSLLGIGLVLATGYFARDPLFFAFLYRGTRADWELSQIRDEYARQQRKLVELGPDEVAERHFAAWEEEKRERCMQIAEDHQGTRAEATALLFVADRWKDSPEGKLAYSRLLATASDSNIGAWAWALDRVRVVNDDTEYWRPLVAELVDRVKADPEHPSAALLVTKAGNLVVAERNAESASDEFVEIAKLIRSHFAGSPDIANFCEQVSGMGQAPDWSREFEPHIHRILEVNQDRFVRCSAKMALAAIVRNGGVERQPEARRLLEEFLDEFDGETDYHAAGIERTYRHEAQQILDSLRTHGLGMPAPDTVGIDLEGQPISLADYRGQVVLVSFWATWCYPCMEAIPHEKDLLDRFGSAGFTIVGVNADKELSTAQEAVARHGIGWRSFQVKKKDGSSIANDWHIAGYPTFYLLDQDGVVAETWLGMPPLRKLNEAIRRLLAVPEAENSAADLMPTESDSLGDKKTELNLPLEITIDSQNSTGFVERILRRENRRQSKYVVFVPKSYDSAERYPAILFLHGTGVQGTDGRKHLTALAHAINRRKSSFPFIAIFPQSPSGDWQPKSGNGDLALAVLDDVMEAYSVDPDRVALTGVSMGGEGTWSLAAAYPNRWCAIIPICGGGNPNTVDRIFRIPCWCFHGGSDRMIPPENSRQMVRALRNAGGQPTYIEYPNIGHNCWDLAYASEDLFRWLMDQRRWPRDSTDSK